jgi:hypothetical protein
VFLCGNLEKMDIQKEMTNQQKENEELSDNSLGSIEKTYNDLIGNLTLGEKNLVEEQKNGKCCFHF